MKWYVKLPVRVLLIPTIWVFLAVTAIAIPFLCLFGELRFLDGTKTKDGYGDEEDHF